MTRVLRPEVTEPERFPTKDGGAEWLLLGRRHNTSGPAYISKDGTRREWYVDGKLSRDPADGPAVEDDRTGAYAYMVDGKRHNPLGAAVRTESGVLEWWLDDEMHREDGPAIVRPDGTWQWRYHGQMHCPWPATQQADGSFTWHPQQDGPPGPAAYDAAKRALVWATAGKIERDPADGPAVITLPADQPAFPIENWEQAAAWSFRRRGKADREGAPAEKLADGVLLYQRAGRLHREDGPAVIHPNGTLSYFLEGKEVSRARVDEDYNPAIDAFGLFAGDC